MFKKLVINAVLCAAIASPAMAYKNWEQSSDITGTTTYTFWCEEGQVVTLIFMSSDTVKAKYGYDTMDQVLAAQGCT